jgi:hypothetical protein
LTGEQIRHNEEYFCLSNFPGIAIFWSVNDTTEMAKISEEAVDRIFLIFIFQNVEMPRETTAGKDTGPFIVEQFKCQEYKHGENFLGDRSGM